MMNEVPEDIHQLEEYIDHINLDDKPTNVLVRLAEQWKRRRRKLYKDLRNPDRYFKFLIIISCLDLYWALIIT